MPAVEEKVRINRILKIDDAIRAGKFPNAASLARKLEVNSRTIQRDIEYLRDMYEAPIEYDYAKKGYYYTEPNFFIKSILLTEGELFSVALFERLLEDYRNTPLEADLKNIFSKIAESLPDNISIDAGMLPTKTTFISMHPVQIDNEVFTIIFMALRKHLAVKLEYRKLDAIKHEARTLEPYHAIVHRGYWYIIAHCRETDKTHVYMLSRMRNAKITKNSFIVPDDFVPEKYFDKNVGILSLDGTVYDFEFVIDKSIGTFAMERFYHETQKVSQDSDGTVHVAFSTTQLMEEFRWVLSQGSKLKVVKPAILVEMVAAEAEKTAALYKKK